MNYKDLEKILDTATVMDVLDGLETYCQKHEALNHSTEIKAKYNFLYIALRGLTDLISVSEL